MMFTVDRACVASCITLWVRIWSWHGSDITWNIVNIWILRQDLLLEAIGGSIQFDVQDDTL